MPWQVKPWKFWEPVTSRLPPHAVAILEEGSSKCGTVTANVLFANALLSCILHCKLKKLLAPRQNMKYI
jgi:hypothetical protein